MLITNLGIIVHGQKNGLIFNIKWGVFGNYIHAFWAKNSLKQGISQIFKELKENIMKPVNLLKWLVLESLL